MHFQQAIANLIEEDIRSFQKTTSVEQEVEKECLEKVAAWRDGEIDIEELQRFYEHVKCARGEIDVEEMLIKSAPIEEFKALGIPEYAIPYRYGPLPIADSDTEYKLFQVDSGFVHLDSLKRSYIERAVYSTYENRDPMSGSVVILCYVIADGMGDLIAGLRATRLIKGAFPGLDIKLVLIGYEDFIRDGNSYSHYNHTYEWGDLDVRTLTATYKVVDTKPGPVEISQEIKEAIKEADLTVQIPTNFPQWESELAPLVTGRARTVGEYGFMRASWCNPKSAGWSLGLHYLEKGILDQPLPPRISLPPFERQTHLCLARTTRASSILFNTILMSNLSDSIDIIVSSPEHIIETLNQLKKRALNIAKLTIVTPDETQSETFLESGRELRIICKQLSRKECIETMRTSSEPFLVRGNQSFSEAVSVGRLFFYDTAEHNKPFIEGFHQMAKTVFEKGSPICDYTSAMCDYTTPPEKIAERITPLIKTTQLQTEMATLCKLIKERHPFNPNLLNLIRRELAPAPTREREEHLIQQFLRGTLSFKGLIKNLNTI